MAPLEDNAIFSKVYEFVHGLAGTDAAWLAYGVAAMAVILVVVNGFLALGMLFTWFERKLVGRFQSRVGPNRAGPFGLLQAIADGIKLLFKEDIVPRRADRVMFNAAPIVMLAPAVMALGVIPFGPGSFIADLNIGLLYVAAMSGIASLAVLMAGYASANKLAMFGSMRAVALLVSYEIPLIMALLAVTLLAGSMSLVDVVDAQAVPFILVTPLGVSGVPGRNLGRAEPSALRRDGSGVGARRGLPDRVQRDEVRRLLPRRIRQRRAGRSAVRGALPRRLERPRPPAAPVVSHQGLRVPVRRVLGEGHRSPGSVSTRFSVSRGRSFSR